VPPSGQLEILDSEIRRYSPELAMRPRVILINKADLADVTDLADEIGALAVSAVTGAGLERAMHAIGDRVEEATRAAPERKGYVLHRPLGPTFSIVKEGAAWRIEGRAAERAVRFADLTLPEAADMAARRLADLGVDRALAEAGAVEGDEVRIGDLSFEYTVTEEE
jgi:GTP-binding protein